MTVFQPSDAAISGFRFIVRQPRTVLIWAAIFFAYDLLSGGLLVGLAGDRLPAIRALAETNSQDPEAAIAMLPSVSFIFLFNSLAVLGLAAVMFTAAYRALLSEAPDRFAFLRFGRDEIRMAVLIVLWVALSLGYTVLVGTLSGLFSLLGSPLPGFLRGIYLLLVLAASVCAFVYPLVRLSFAMPMTLEDHHVRLFESWRPTHGRFWPLFSGYALAAILIMVMIMVEWTVVVVVGAIVIVASGLSLSDISGIYKADTTSLATYFSITTVIGLLLHSLALGAGLPIFIGPVAEAYRRFVLERGAHEEANAASAG